ncbi:MAG: hypothetical protein NTW86_03705 [Candidatus Sumerlaeota bacterium]|nr:hypothetical protein [Candidatus Sumerlaeota bacterium]
MMKRILALVCAICPFCIAKRQWPDSAYARKMNELEKDCPCCRAYRECKAGKAAKGA